MSIQHVNIVPAEEQFAPPDQMIELAVVGAVGNPERPMVILSLVEYDETNERTIATRKVEFPAMYLEDVVRALGAFAVAGQALHLSHGIPFQLPAEPSASPSA
jgi:hypothetical protein